MALPEQKVGRRKFKLCFQMAQEAKEIYACTSNNLYKSRTWPEGIKW